MKTDKKDKISTHHNFNQLSHINGFKKQNYFKLCQNNLISMTEDFQTSQMNGKVLRNTRFFYLFHTFRNESKGRCQSLNTKTQELFSSVLFI